MRLYANSGVRNLRIKLLTDGRNSLFHSGSDFPELTLWNTLFPLVTQIVEYVSCNQGCLDASAANKADYVAIRSIGI